MKNVFAPHVRLSARVLRSAIFSATLIALLLCSAELRSGTSWFHKSAKPSPEPAIGRMELPDKGATVVIFAPHPDDETLGCGGYIQKAVKAGANVRIVVVTNGEYSSTVVQSVKESQPERAQSYIELGQIRQDETLMAVGALGVPSSSVTFLGYPNHFMENLWSLDHWLPTDPIKSIRLNTTESPYPNSMTPGAIYCGQSLVKDIRTILMHEKPDVVITLHPNDVHHDHWPVYTATRFALEELRVEGESFARECKVYTYIIHRYKWPQPCLFANKLDMAPPSNLINISDWLSLPLTREQTDRKGRAIAVFKSQGGDTKPFMRSFARKTELYAIQPVLKWPASQSVPLRRIIRDPIGGNRGCVFHNNGDMVAVRMGRRGGKMLVRVDTRGNITPITIFHLCLHSGGKGINDRILAAYDWHETHALGKILQDGKITEIKHDKLKSRTTGRQAYLEAPWPFSDKRTKFFMARVTSSEAKTFVDVTQTATFRIAGSTK